MLGSASASALALPWSRVDKLHDMLRSSPRILRFVIPANLSLITLVVVSSRIVRSTLLLWDWDSSWAGDGGKTMTSAPLRLMLRLVHPCEVPYCSTDVAVLAGLTALLPDDCALRSTGNP